jgi:alkylation response protein AidB-like acyl-CoA dehydrogenase
VSDDLRGFADEVRSFVRAELPPAVKAKVLNRRRPSRDEQIAWQHTLHARGWAAPAWPKEFGGPGWSALQCHVYDEVASDEGAPEAIPFGEGMLAPILMAVGTPEQQRHYLPRIRTLEYWFCQGFSEPGAGSDLASLKTRARLDGQHWVINGQKAWTTLAHYANMMFCLVRTDPQAAKPQAGISMLIVPMATPGIVVRPVITLTGEHTVNEVFFDDVRVPRDHMVGEVNQGWRYAKMLLGFERTGIARIGQSKRELRLLKEIARREGLSESPVFRNKIAEVEIDLMAVDQCALRMIAASGRNVPGTEANLLKIKGSEIQQRLSELKLEAVGPRALAYEPDLLHGDAADPGYAGHLAASYFMTRVVSIYGGSNEIQRNVLAKAALDL